MRRRVQPLSKKVRNEVQVQTARCAKLLVLVELSVRLISLSLHRRQCWSLRRTPRVSVVAGRHGREAGRLGQTRSHRHR